MQRTLRACSLAADSARLLNLPVLGSCTRSSPACPSMRVRSGQPLPAVWGDPRGCAPARGCQRAPGRRRARGWRRGCSCARWSRAAPAPRPGAVTQSGVCDVSQPGVWCLVRPRQRTPARHACSHAGLSTQACSAPDQCRVVPSPACEQLGTMHKICMEQGGVAWLHKLVS